MATDKASDFVEVQLTAAGAKRAPVGIATAHLQYAFAAGARVRVLTSEWRRVLARQKLGGETIFEIAPPVAAVGPLAATTAAKKAAPENEQKQAQTAQEAK